MEKAVCDRVWAHGPPPHQYLTANIQGPMYSVHLPGSALEEACWIPPGVGLGTLMLTWNERDCTARRHDFGQPLFVRVLSSIDDRLRALLLTRPAWDGHRWSRNIANNVAISPRGRCPRAVGHYSYGRQSFIASANPGLCLVKPATGCIRCRRCSILCLECVFPSISTRGPLSQSICQIPAAIFANYAFEPTSDQPRVATIHFLAWGFVRKYRQISSC